MKSAIKIEADEFVQDTEQARHDFAKVTGHEFVLKPAVFLHTETGQRYCNIVGGLAYPTSSEPGVVIILGIQNVPVVTFNVLDAYEDIDVFVLIEKCIEMRSKWGFWLDSRILPNWYGDQEKFQTLIIKASAVLEQKLGTEQGLYVKDMVDLRNRDAFPLYTRQISNSLLTKTLNINKNGVIISHLQGFDRTDAERGKVQDFPTIGLLGGMVHSLQNEKPWEEDITQGEAFNIG